MYREFRVEWEGVVPGDPQQVWDAITRRAAAWIWPIEYEPRVGGAERGLTTDGGVVTAWEPPRHFQTRGERESGWHNTLDYTLEPCGDATLMRYVHTSVEQEEDYDATLDACRRHTAFYLHSFAEYLRHFAGRDAKYVEIEAPGSFAEVLARLGVPAGASVGDTALGGTIDYRTPEFLGVRTEDAFVRVFGREQWGGPVSVYLHLFVDDADAAAAERDWTARLAPAKVAV